MKETKGDEELLTVARIERLLAKMPDEAARHRVLTYLVSRHQVQQKPLQPGGCNAVPLVPGRPAP